MEVFHRKSLAAQLARQILGEHAGSATPSGVFLAAPRRTGKSTFIREDLRPELEAGGSVVVYADLWEDRKADPGQVILSAVRAELAKHDGVIKRLARAAGIEKVNLNAMGGGVALTLDKIGMPDGISVAAALAALSDETRQRIVLVIDEAQHAITSETGNNALFALKAARDELNSSRHHGLRIVATGSNRDKLAMLRNNREQAFYGAPLVDFPLLGPDYVQWFCERVSLPGKLDPKAVSTLFKQASYKPEILAAAADMLRFDFELKAKDVATRFRAAVLQQVDAADAELLRIVHSLTPLQSAVLRVLAARGKDYAPFETSSVGAYQAVLKSDDPRAPRPDVSNIQQALSALQDRGLAWKAARGVYDIEDSNIVSVLKRAGLLDAVPPLTDGPGQRRARP